MVAQYIAAQPIMDLCKRSSRRPVVWVSWRWWDQEFLDLEESKESAAVDSDGEKA